jgi:4-amino-4-deoxy-L-arabinose transferase-like glycosyltransferase
VLAVAVRLPFLLSGKIPFDSDEAVEGLMALHVPNGELPVFFWGQAFKGIPEVYAAAVAFSVFGPSVTMLKGVTLAFFAVFVMLHFILLEKIASRWIAAAASLLLIFSPPALVVWSLSASAEYILIMLLGTTLVLLCLRLEQSEKSQPRAHMSIALRLTIGLCIGLGLWVHQVFAVYLLPASLILVLKSQWWRERRFGRVRAPALALLAFVAIYVVLGAVAFLTGGFSFQLGPLAIGVRAPQKMLRIAAAIGVLGLIVHSLSNASRGNIGRFLRTYWAIAAGLLLGYLPVLLYSVFVEPARSPARVADLRRLVKVTPDIVGNIVPILAGFKIPTTERLPLPLIALTPGAAALAAYLWSNRVRIGRAITLRTPNASFANDFFPTYVLFVPALFLAGGVYVDTQSYRYLIPWYAGLSVAWAAGSAALARDRKARASVILAAILVVHVWQQAIWYGKLSTDTQSQATIDCLKQNGIRGGFADYWTSYKLTFLSNEEIIIAPNNGVDRYPRYTEYVRSLPAERQVSDPADCKGPP